MGDGIRAAWEFARAWRESTARACRPQYGILLAIPVVWACLEAYVFPRAAIFGFLAMALFLERRPGRRLLFQALIFAGWSSWLELRPPDPSPCPVASSAQSFRIVTGEVAGFPSGTGRLAFALRTDP